MIERLDQITPREMSLHRQELEVLEKQIAHSERLKEMELEIAKIDAKWSAVFKIPLTLIKMPVLIVMAVGYCLAVWKGKEPSQDFWRFLR